MSKYLKMADVFVGEYKPAIRRDSVPANRYGEPSIELYGIPANYAAHAINSHDELAAMNQELLEALEWSDKQIMEFISIAFRHAEIRGDFELPDVRDALNMIKSNAIAKAKGQ